MMSKKWDGAQVVGVHGEGKAEAPQLLRASLWKEFNPCQTTDSLDGNGSHT